MRPRTLAALLFLAIALAGLWPQGANAVPVFARKYGFECTMCHSNIPRLNDFGQLYRMNGYRLPGRENEEKTVLQVQAPIAFRTSAGYNVENYNSDSETDLSAFQLNGLDLLSAGVLARKMGYFMVYVPQMASSRGVAGQEGSLEMASVVMNHLGSQWVNLRVGRFEPAYVPFSVKRQLGVAPYEVYEAAFPGGPAFSETQSGLEFYGWGRQRLAYALGWVTGSETNQPDDVPADVYGRVSWVLGNGWGQTMGQRIGVVGYLGQARPNLRATVGQESFYRLGADASLNAFHCNLALQYLYGREDPVLWDREAGADDVTWSGGFAELSCLPRVDLVAFARFDFVDAPTGSNTDVTRATVGGRYYFVDNVALHLEYSYRTMNAAIEGADDATLSFVTARLDLAF
jgi:hypothetical protein